MNRAQLIEDNVARTQQRLRACAAPAFDVPLYEPVDDWDGMSRSEALRRLLVPPLSRGQRVKSWLQRLARTNATAVRRL